MWWLHAISLAVIFTYIKAVLQLRKLADQGMLTECVISSVTAAQVPCSQFIVFCNHGVIVFI